MPSALQSGSHNVMTRDVCGSEDAHAVAGASIDRSGAARETERQHGQRAMRACATLWLGVYCTYLYLVHTDGSRLTSVFTYTNGNAHDAALSYN